MPLLADTGQVAGLLSQFGIKSKAEQEQEEQAQQQAQQQARYSALYHQRAQQQGQQQGSLLRGPNPFDEPFQPEGGVRGPQAAQSNQPDGGGRIPNFLRKLIGNENVPPELAQLLTPEQQQDVTPGLWTTIGNFLKDGSTPRQRMMNRTREILAYGDLGTARTNDRRLASERSRIAQEYASDPSGMAREMAAAGVWQPQEAASFAKAYEPADQERPQSLGGNAFWNPLERRVEYVDAPPTRPLSPSTRNTAQGVQNWNPDARKWEFEIDETGSRVMPWAQPIQPGFTTPAGVVGPGGRPMVLNTKTGQFVEAPEGTARQTGSPITPMERNLAASDARLSIATLMGPDGKMKPPPNSLDRVATRSDWTNWMASDYGQSYMNNVRKLIRAWAVVIEGKRFSDKDQEFQEAQRSFRPFEGTLTLEGKQLTIENMARDLQGAIRAPGSGGRSGGAGRPSGSIPPRPASATDAEWAQYLKDRGFTP